MKKIEFEIWKYYFNLPIENKLKRCVFYKRLKRFFNSKRYLCKNSFYDFFLIRIMKKDLLKWARYFEKNKIIFK